MFTFFYCLFNKDIPNINTSVKERILGYGFSIISTAICSLLSFTLFKTAFAVIPWAILGWVLPSWIKESIERRKNKKFKVLARNFVTTAAGMYSAGLLTHEVVRTMATKMPEPLGSEFEEMISRRNLSANASFPRMFVELGEKYQLEEFKAVSAIIAASERVGGPKSASKGLKRLGQALRQQERLASERTKATLEPKIAAIFVIGILLFGLLLDTTVLSSFFQGAGKLVMALSSALTVGLIFMYKKIMAGGVSS